MIKATLTDGRKVKVNYPTDQSATQYQNLLETRTSPSTRRVGTSAWWALLTGLLPFVLLIGFWPS